MRQLTLTILLAAVLPAIAQDSVLNRNVTVEREFQPIIQAAGKVNSKPEVTEPQIDPAPITYSDYTSSIAPDYNVTTLLSQPTRFTTPKPLNGELTAGIGHTSTMLDFQYRLHDKHNNLRLFAEHEACWGRKAMENTQIGMDYKHHFSGCTVYFDVNGGNRFYTRYGHYYDPESKEGVEKHFSELTGPRDRETAWMGGANIGVRSKHGNAIDYDVTLGYHAFHMPTWATEHQINTRAKVAWTSDVHKVGFNLDLLDLLYDIRTTLPDGKTNQPRHSLLMEPYYEYHGQRIMLHAGVNFDLAIGKGQMLSASSEIAFAPSPEIRMEAQLVPRWLALYANVEGRFARGSLQAYNNLNPYMNIMPILYSRHVGEYSPVDAEIGFNIRPQKELLLQIHAGYACKLNRKASYIHLESDGVGVADGMLNYFYTTLHCLKVGGQLAYHWRDILDIHVWGDYYFGPQNIDSIWFESRYADHPEYARPVQGHFYDLNPFVIGARIDGHIDEHWSVYTTLYARGGSTILTTLGERKLKPIVDWNIGAAYDWKEKNLRFFAQLNNLICRYNDLYYGYKSEGTNFLLGATWQF